MARIITNYFESQEEAWGFARGCSVLGYIVVDYGVKNGTFYVSYKKRR